MTAASNSDVLPSAEFRVGRVLSRSFGILTRHFLKFLLLAVITLAPSLLLALFGVSSFRPGPGGFSGGSALSLGVSGLVWMVLYMLCQAVVLYGAFQDMRGRPFDIGTSFKLGLARLLPVVGISFCIAIAMFVGFLLLIVPGLIAVAMFYVSLPVCVVEKRGVFASMGRSQQLTRGHRWRIFGIYLLLALGIAISGGILQAVAGGVARSIVGPALAIAIALIVNFFWSALANAFQAVVAAVIYHDLRVLKEGVDVEQIAAVFD